MKEKMTYDLLRRILENCSRHKYIRTVGVTFVAGHPPIWEKDGSSSVLSSYFRLEEKHIREIAALVGYEERINKEEDEEFCCFSYEDDELGRYRVTVAKAEDSPIITMRHIPKVIKNFEQLNLPKKALARIAQINSGLILITGATGQGKTTTIASLIEYIKNHCPRNKHIMTIEDPIEYTYRDLEPLVTQREVGRHVRSYSSGVYQALRMNPSVLICGEIRDRETLEAVLHASESSLQVIASIHCPDVLTTLSYITGRYEKEAERTINQRLANNLKAVFSQRLIEHTQNNLGYALMPIAEMLLVGESERQAILTGDLERLSELMETSGRTSKDTFPNFEDFQNWPSIVGEEFDVEISWPHDGLASVGSWKFDQYLRELYQQRVVDKSLAILYAQRAEEMSARLETVPTKEDSLSK
jgi:pilus retraction protein PilT